MKTHKAYSHYHRSILFLSNAKLRLFTTYFFEKIHFMTRTAVVLLNLGGPDALTNVKPFLFNLFNDPAILRMPTVFRYLLAKLISTLRAKKAQGIYERLGGKSPLLDNTIDQSNALQQTLQTHGIDIKTFVCMRYWHPMAPEVVKDVHAFSPDTIILLPLYPQFSTTTTESSFNDWQTAWQNAGLSSVPTQTIDCYPIDPLLIRAFTQLTLPVIKEAATYGKPHVLFSAHGLPQSVIDAGDPYQHQVEQTVQHISLSLKQQLGDTFDTTICYQSRVGPKKWLEPATDVVIKTIAAQGKPIVIVPVAFVSDHSETLVELDQDYRDLATTKGAPFYGRVPSLACHPDFIAALAERVIKTLNK